MSIWYQFDVVAFGDRKAIGKFFNLNPEEDINYIDRFGFSFGQKNVPGLRFGKLMEQNPGLIFLVKQSTDYNCMYSLNWVPSATQPMKYLFLQEHTFGVGNAFSKELLKLYESKYPYLLKQHSGGRPYDWESFIGSFENAEKLLANSDLYKTRVTALSQEDFESDLAGNDYLGDYD